jgi:hypothetical protein
MKQVFKCDYCSTQGNKEYIEEHQKVCTKNPDNKHCDTCRCFDILVISASKQGLAYWCMKKDFKRIIKSRVSNCINWENK